MRDHLYERAVGDTRPPALWHVGNDLSLFAGCLQRNAMHSHSVAVFLTGLSDAFSLRVGNGAWRTCRAAVIPAGVRYEFNMRGAPLAVAYLEPTAGPAALLAPLLRNADEADGALLSAHCTNGMMRELFEDPTSHDWAGEALGDLLGFLAPRTARRLDERIARAVRAIQEERKTADSSVTVKSAAARAGLSPSRFQHLFSDEVGVPFRRYRAWQRMLAAIGEVTSGANLTTAAHAAGYCDQPHFAHEFRRVFGAPAGPSLRSARGRPD
jgi:AraC-like DNA-binding protein